jgi:hypothetical protein
MMAVLIAFAAMMGPSLMTGQQQQAFAQSAEDANGIQLKDPLATYDLAYELQYYQTHSAFQTSLGTASDPGSMRMHFKGLFTNNLMMAGFFKVSPESCTAGGNPGGNGDPNEDVAAILNGGPHTSTGTSGSTTEPNDTWADSMVLDTTDLDLDESRVRWEKTHPTLTSDIDPDAGQSVLPLASPATLCSVPGGYFGVMVFKLNLDSNCDGHIDWISLISYIDVTGLNTDGTPKNNWVKTYRNDFRLSEIDLKGKTQPYVKAIGFPEERYQTFRIDAQDQTDWTDSDPNFKYLTLKRVQPTHTNCASAMSSSEALAADEEVPIEGVTTTVDETAASTETATNEDEDTVEQTDTAVIDQEEEEQEQEENAEDEDNDNNNNSTEEEEEE